MRGVSRIWFSFTKAALPTLGPFTFVTSDAMGIGGQDVSAWLSVLPRRSDHIILQSSQVRRMVSEDSQAAFGYFSEKAEPFLLVVQLPVDFHCHLFHSFDHELVASTAVFWMFQHIAGFCSRNYSGPHL